MITRRRCRKIAFEWQVAQGIAEYQRRRDSVFGADDGLLLRMPAQQAARLERGMAEAVLGGYYDPPMPKIPGFWQRLRLRDWVPPQTDWPMYTGRRG